MSLAATVWSAIDELRSRIAQPAGLICVLTPSSTNALLLRQQLSLQRDMIRVDCSTPARLLDDLGRDNLPPGLLPEPPGWLWASLTGILAAHQPSDPVFFEPVQATPEGAAHAALSQQHPLDRYAQTLRDAGWSAALLRTLSRLEEAGAQPHMLRELVQGSAQPQRLRLLAHLLEAIQAARSAEGLATRFDLWAAARAALGQQLPHPAHRFQAAIVVGDASLPAGLFVALQQWLALRPCLRIAVYPLENVAAAPLGLRLAAQHAELRQDPVAAAGALGRCRRSLFLPPAPEPAGAAPDDSLHLVRCPDERRELSETVRRVLRAIRAGTPLDRIAIVLADAKQADALRDDLHRASIPAVWLVGAPLSQGPTARFLSLVLELAVKEQSEPGCSVVDWYVLLSHPKLRFLDAPTQHRGRWRRLLSRCQAHQGSARLLEALGQCGEGPMDDGDDAAALASLRFHLQQLAQLLRTLNQQLTLGEHARAWLEVLAHRWRRGRDQDAVEQLLLSWASSRLGPALSLPSAIQIFRENCEQHQALKGNLSQAGIRVLPPMAMLGAAFDLVCCPGLDHGRFPAEAKQDPLVSDDELEALASRLGVRVISSRDQNDSERRRLAAVLCACEGSAWLAWPASDLVSARPRIAGRHLLELATAMLGRRVSFSTLHGLVRQAGSRAQVLPPPDQALGPLERLAALASLASQQAQANQAREGHASSRQSEGFAAAASSVPESELIPVQQSDLACAPVLEQLSGHRWARGLLCLHRSVHATTRGDALPDAWTGLLSPALMPAPWLSGGALSVQQLAQLLREPQELLLHQMLRAYPPPRLYASSGFLEQSEKRFLRCVDTALQTHAQAPQNGGLEPHFAQALEQELDRCSRWMSDAETQLLNDERSLQAKRLRNLQAQFAGHELPRPEQLEQALPLYDELGFSLHTGKAWLQGDALIVYQTSTKVRKSEALYLQHLEACLTALVIARKHSKLTRVLVFTPGACATIELAHAEPALRPLVELACQRAALGWWSTPPASLCLGDEYPLHLLKDRQHIETIVSALTPPQSLSSHGSTSA